MPDKIAKVAKVAKVESVVEKHYLRAVAFLILMIIVGSAFWGLRRFKPALFLGKPDLITVPNEELPTERKQTPSEKKPELLNINNASAKELQSLPRIGENMAFRIIEYREVHGRFASVQELTKVKGIGEKTLEKLRPFICVE